MDLCQVNFTYIASNYKSQICFVELYDLFNIWHLRSVDSLFDRGKSLQKKLLIEKKEGRNLKKMDRQATDVTE